MLADLEDHARDPLAGALGNDFDNLLGDTQLVHATLETHEPNIGPSSSRTLYSNAPSRSSSVRLR